ncbi:MAG: aldolase [Burkholderiaceae bacterium]
MTVDKQQAYDNFQQEAARHLAMPGWSEPQRLALACRMLAREGHAQTLAGQVTAKADDDGVVWTPPLGLGLDEVTPPALIQVDADLKRLRGTGMANPAVRFHWWVYRARPRVRCIVHTHPPFVSALSMLGVPLKVAHMDAAMFYDDCAYLAQWPGVPVADDEGELIAGALGDKRSILLAHHGLLCTGQTIQEATYLALNLEWAARVQLRAMAAGTIQTVEPAHARDAREFLLRPEIVDASFHREARRVLAADPSIL